MLLTAAGADHAGGRSSVGSGAIRRWIALYARACVDEELDALCCWRAAPAHWRWSKLRSGSMARRLAIVIGRSSSEAFEVAAMSVEVELSSD
jgi:hypothetical protein